VKGIQIITVYRWHDLIYRKPQRLHQKLLELRNKFSKVAEYKISTQNSVALLYTNSKLPETEIKKAISLTLDMENQEIKFNQRGERSLMKILKHGWK
jgi:hypothetical protein